MTDDWYCCDAPRPSGFTYHPSGVTSCNTCFTQFPYYDCFCELVHACPTDAEDLENGYFSAMEVVLPHGDMGS